VGKGFWESLMTFYASSPEQVKETRTIDRQLFFRFGAAVKKTEAAKWKATLKGLGIRTRVENDDSVGTGLQGLAALFGDNFVLWCNVNDFRKAMRNYNLTFISLVHSFSGILLASPHDYRLPTKPQKRSKK